MAQIKFIRKSLELTEKQWEVLELLAEKFNACPPSGPTAGSPSWRTLIKLIAAGDLNVTPAPRPPVNSGGVYTFANGNVVINIPGKMTLAAGIFTLPDGTKSNE